MELHFAHNGRWLGEEMQGRRPTRFGARMALTHGEWQHVIFVQCGCSPGNAARVVELPAHSAYAIHVLVSELGGLVRGWQYCHSITLISLARASKNKYRDVRIWPVSSPKSSHSRLWGDGEQGAVEHAVLGGEIVELWKDPMTAAEWRQRKFGRPWSSGQGSVRRIIRLDSTRTVSGRICVLLQQMGWMIHASRK